MVFVSATRLRVGSVFNLRAFFRANEASIKQLLQTEGFIAGAELPDWGLVFWTITLWGDEAAMRSFRNSEAHRKAMQKLPDWCSEASYTHWQQEEATLPDWDVIYNKMMSEGKLTKVRKPSKRQLTKDYPPVKWRKLMRPLKPANPL